MHGSSRSFVFSPSGRWAASVDPQGEASAGLSAEWTTARSVAPFGGSGFRLVPAIAPASAVAVSIGDDGGLVGMDGGGNLRVAGPDQTKWRVVRRGAGAVRTALATAVNSAFEWAVASSTRRGDVVMWRNGQTMREWEVVDRMQVAAMRLVGGALYLVLSAPDGSLRGGPWKRGTRPAASRFARLAVPQPTVTFASVCRDGSIFIASEERNPKPNFGDEPSHERVLATTFSLHDSGGQVLARMDLGSSRAPLPIVSHARDATGASHVVVMGARARIFTFSDGRRDERWLTDVLSTRAHPGSGLVDVANASLDPFGRYLAGMTHGGDAFVRRLDDMRTAPVDRSAHRPATAEPPRPRSVWGALYVTDAGEGACQRAIAEAYADAGCTWVQFPTVEAALASDVLESSIPPATPNPEPALGADEVLVFADGAAEPDWVGVFSRRWERVVEWHPLALAISRRGIDVLEVRSEVAYAALIRYVNGEAAGALVVGEPPAHLVSVPPLDLDWLCARLDARAEVTPANVADFLEQPDRLLARGIHTICGHRDAFAAAPLEDYGIDDFMVFR